VYVAAMAAQHPQRVPNLMAYLFQTVKHAKKFKWPSWVIYMTRISDRKWQLNRSGTGLKQTPVCTLSVSYMPWTPPRKAGANFDNRWTMVPVVAA